MLWDNFTLKRNLVLSLVSFAWFRFTLFLHKYENMSIELTNVDASEIDGHLGSTFSVGKTGVISDVPVW